jgi:[CysO sulfur-carrier protein]-S-L-cysteine hydrolase
MVVVLAIRQDLVDAMVAHARRDHPDEACGILAGPEDSDRPKRIIEMQNAERSTTGYRFDEAENFRVNRELTAAGESVVVIYHSHTATEAYPSRTDVRWALTPEAHYVIISTRDPDDYELRSFRITKRDLTDEGGEVTEEDVDVVESYMFSHTGADDVPDA